MKTTNSNNTEPSILRAIGFNSKGLSKRCALQSLGGGGELPWWQRQRINHWLDGLYPADINKNHPIVGSIVEGTNHPRSTATCMPIQVVVQSRVILMCRMIGVANDDMYHAMTLRRNIFHCQHVLEPQGSQLVVGYARRYVRFVSATAEHLLWEP